MTGKRALRRPSPGGNPAADQRGPKETLGRSNQPERRSFSADKSKTYILFFKPYGVLTQFTQPEGSDKLTLSEFGLPQNVYPVGRLDYDSEGILVLTDDTYMNKALLDPIYGHDRTYLAQVENVPSSDQLELLKTGVMIDQQRTAPAEAELLEHPPALPERSVPIRVRKNIPTAWILLTLREGKNRQVRRMTAAAGCPTLRLMRVAIGRVSLFRVVLQPGEWIKMSSEQVHMLFEKADDKLEIPGDHR